MRNRVYGAVLSENNAVNKSNNYDFKGVLASVFLFRWVVGPFLHLKIFHFHSRRSVNACFRRCFPVDHKLFIIKGPSPTILHTPLT